ncbi:MAG: DUF3365 domain-containing protein [Betaproteobacteria bacterium]|nr:DUF3365 domain-containing protein [Betaproteobacteria bacterium]
MYIMLTNQHISPRKAMKHALSISVLYSLCFFMGSATAQDSDLLSQSRTISQAMLKELGQKLQSAMADGGAVNAIGVCNTQAPEIAGRVSAQNQVMLSRVGTRARNPVMGVPNDWQSKALAQFEQALARGDKLADLEFSETVVKPDGGKEFHFAKPIVLQPMCVSCHGGPEQISPEVKAKLTALYPNDKAINYQPGQLRGAVVLSRNLP